MGGGGEGKIKGGFQGYIPKKLIISYFSKMYQLSLSTLHCIVGLF